jgi:hypothetical protein
MKKHTDKNQQNKHKIDAIEVSSDNLSSRAGLTLCVTCTNQIDILTNLERCSIFSEQVAGLDDFALAILTIK